MRKNHKRDSNGTWKTAGRKGYLMTAIVWLFFSDIKVEIPVRPDESYDDAWYKENS